MTAPPSATPPTPATTACRNCGQPVPAAAATCVWCGVAQQPAATSFVVAPGAASAAGGRLAASSPEAVSTLMAADPQNVGAVRAPAPRAVPRPPVSLGPEYRGSAAATAARVAAFSVDVLAVVVAVLVAGLVAGSAIFAGIVALDLVVLLWVLEGRTGLTLGNALLRVRTARDDAPFSPGIGRSFVRLLVTGMGFFAVVVGAWIVVASSAWDPRGLRRGWADRAARTVTVAVARRERTASSLAGPSRVGPSVVAPSVAPPALARAPEVHTIGRDDAQPSGSGLAAPHLTNARGHSSSSLEHSESVSHTGVTVAGSPDPVAITPASAPAIRIAPAPGTLPAPLEDDGPKAPSQGSLLLVFDTGQRETLRMPAVANLGRKPAATDTGDQLISVTDSEGTVSKTHLRLEHSRGRTWVTDLGSTNGSDLIEDDGEVTALVQGQRTAVQDGSRVRIGNRTFTVSVLLDGADQSGESLS